MSATSENSPVRSVLSGAANEMIGQPSPSTITGDTPQPKRQRTEPPQETLDQIAASLQASNEIMQQLAALEQEEKELAPDATTIRLDPSLVRCPSCRELPMLDPRVNGKCGHSVCFLCVPRNGNCPKCSKSGSWTINFELRDIMSQMPLYQEKLQQHTPDFYLKQLSEKFGYKDPNIKTDYSVAVQARLLKLLVQQVGIWQKSPGYVDLSLLPVGAAASHRDQVYDVIGECIDSDKLIYYHFEFPDNSIRRMCFPKNHPYFVLESDTFMFAMISTTRDIF